jgi:hypothetical protein
MSRYKPRPGKNFYIRTVRDAQTVGKYLERQFPRGQVTPEALVKVARSRSCPLHKYFEWDDRKAAQKYRLHQARQILRAIVIESNDMDIPAYHSVIVVAGNEEHQSYVALNRCRASPNLWNQVLRAALVEARAWSSRYQAYQELAPIREAIQQVEHTIQ